MKAIVFGATGTIGRHLVEQALAKGYQVTAFCRNPDAIELQNPNLKLVKGDVFNKKEVQHAVQGQDVVCIALGSGKKRKGNVRSKGTQHVIDAMQMHGVKRLICQTTLGIGDSQGNLNFFWKRIMFGWFLKEVFQDHVLQEGYVRDSGLDWTIVRPAAFTDGSQTGNYRHGFSAHEAGLKLKISRADVANFMIGQFSNMQYLHQTPGLSY